MSKAAVEWSDEWSDWQFASGPVIAPVNYSAVLNSASYLSSYGYAAGGYGTNSTSPPGHQHHAERPQPELCLR